MYFEDDNDEKLIFKITPEIKAWLDKIYNEHLKKFPNVSFEEQQAKLDEELNELREAKAECYSLDGNDIKKNLKVYEEQADVIICCIRLIGSWHDKRASELLDKYLNYVTIPFVLQKWELVKKREYKNNHHI